jgi:hypothetical protein
MPCAKLAGRIGSCQGAPLPALAQMPGAMLEANFSPNGRVAYELTATASPARWRVIPGYFTTDGGQRDA